MAMASVNIKLDPSELYAQSVLKQGVELIEHDRPVEALEALHTLVGVRSRHAWNKFHEDALKLHIEQCFKLRKEPHLRAALQNYRLKTMHLNVSVMGDALAHVLSQTDDLLAKAKEAQNVPSAEDTIVLQLTGRRASEMLSQRRIDGAFQFAMEVTRATLAAVQYVGKYEGLYQHFVRHLMTLCEQHQRRPEFTSLSDLVRKHLDRAFDNADQKLAITNNGESIRSIVITKQHQLKVAASLRLWPSVVQSIDSMRELIGNLRRWEKPIKLADLIPYYSRLTQVFRDASSPHFYAHCAIRLANLKLRSGIESAEAGALSAQAALAAACVPTEVDEATKDRLATLTKAFALTAVPTREGMLTDIQRRGPGGGASLLEQCDPNSQALFAALLRKAGAKEVQALCAALPAHLAHFAQIAHAAALQTALITTGTTCSTIPIAKLCDSCSAGGSTNGSDDDAASVFVAKVEPLLLRSVPLRRECRPTIDLSAGCVRFTAASQSAGDRVAALQGLVTKSLADAMQALRGGGGGSSSASASATAAGPALKKINNPLAGMTPDAIRKRLAAERDRTIARNILSNDRIEKGEERVLAEKRREEDKKKADLRKRQETEEARIAKLRIAHEAALLKKVEELEAVERRRWVLKALTNKHRGLEIPVAAAAKSEHTFLEEATRRLVAHRREAESTKESDVRTMDHYERACREVDGPAREAHAREMAETSRAEQAARRENALKKHYEDWQEKVKTKERLLRFRRHKEQYEAEVQSKLATAVGSAKAGGKRDQEQSALEDFKREREAAAARAAAKEAEAAAPPPKKDAEEPPKKDAAPGKWVPKSRGGGGGAAEAPPVAEKQPEEPAKPAADEKKDDKKDDQKDAGDAKPGKWVPKSRRA